MTQIIIKDNMLKMNLVYSQLPLLGIQLHRMQHKICIIID